MATTATEIETLADLMERLGHVPLTRVRFRPFPGTATEQDVIEAESRFNRLCELIDGVLVEKALGFRESMLGVAMVSRLRAYVRPRNLGLVTGADGPVRLFSGQVRIPDVAFVSWDRIPGGRAPKEPIPDLAPDLAVEVLSEGNTKAEMDRKRDDYFSSGVRLLWFVEPRDRTVSVLWPDGRVVVLDESQTLNGDEVLPGFALPLRELFEELELKKR